MAVAVAVAMLLGCGGVVAVAMVVTPPFPILDLLQIIKITQYIMTQGHWNGFTCIRALKSLTGFCSPAVEILMRILMRIPMRGKRGGSA